MLVLLRNEFNLIKCVKCKEYFLSTGGKNRLCKNKKCHPPKPSSKNYISYSYWNYMSATKRYFQDALYQYNRLQHDETLRDSNKVEYRYE